MRCFWILLVTQFSISAQEIENIFVHSNSLFSASVYKEMLRFTEENFLVSPFSAQVILALAQLGAKNETAEELRISLQLPEHNKIEEGFKNLLSNFAAHEQFYSLSTANKVYIQKDFPIKDEFRAIATNYFNSATENIDFAKKTEASKIINEWVERQTENKIRDLITPEMLSANTALILVNAIYFQAKWLTQFFATATSKNNFFLKAGKTVEVDIMNEDATLYKYFDNIELDAKFLEIPFRDKEVSMTFVLPNEVEGLEKLENQINKVFEPQNFEYYFVNVSIPKFKIESTVDFKTILQNLGVKKAFTDGAADFSGISDRALVISDVLQKTFIDVSEQGVEAAASTEIRFLTYSGRAEPTKSFHADHPFIYFIKVRGVILFAGRVTMPTY
ncbi:antichymotrypsin-2-like isoform X2 [Zophobas morio]|uniref:antichymotrypsin-2-like isoform X2 n=1 Tax=Zophobas morio TaxID=2755281 RepID=UPI0030839A8C